MAMRTSRKGINLNEARYFQHHSPHTRKKMAVMRVFPKTSIINPKLKKPDKIVVNQRSEEVATFIYTDNKSSDSVYSNELKIQDQEIQTDIEYQTQIFQPSRSKRTRPIKSLEVSPKIEASSVLEVSPILDLSNTREIRPKLEVYPKLNPKSLVVKETRDSITHIEDDNSRKTSWWRNNIFKQIIVDFFLQLLGKNVSKKKSRENMTDKYYSVATSTKERGQWSEKKEKNDGKKCKLKKYVNTYEANQHKRRIRRSKGDEVIFDLIRLTQDENLRAAILEQALRTRILEEENARFRKKLAEKLKTRQRSSPFY